jgi:hypothetical protein
MKLKQQLIAVAESQGWTACGGIEGCHPHGYPPDVRKPTTKELLDGTDTSPWDIPNYLTCRDAIYEVVTALPLEKRAEFRKELQYVIAPDTRPGPISQLLLMSNENYDQWFFATAEQWTEAYLRTMNLWKI